MVSRVNLLYPLQQAYFARVSALQELGYGARRLADPMGPGATAEGAVRVPYQVLPTNNSKIG